MKKIFEKILTVLGVIFGVLWLVFTTVNSFIEVPW